MESNNLSFGQYLLKKLEENKEWADKNQDKLKFYKTALIERREIPVTDKEINEFIKYLKENKIEEILENEELSLVDKTDLLVALNPNVFTSKNYVEILLSNITQIPSLGPRLGKYRKHPRDEIRDYDRTMISARDLERVIDNNPNLMDNENIFNIFVRKFENLYFSEFHKNPHETLKLLKEKKKENPLLRKIYDRVIKSYIDARDYKIPGAVSEIKNPRKK